MNKKQKKSILKEYLGFSPVWLDLRKKEILNDGIDISQWQINMNHLIHKYGTIDASEQKAFENWITFFEIDQNDETYFEDYLKEHVTPVLLNISDGELPVILYRDKERNWFLSAYPDVFEYFYPQPNLLAEDFDAEMRRFEAHDEALRPEHERMERYLSDGKANQTIFLLRMKKFYKNELNKDFLLCS
jgi:hypothetical protein